MCASHSITQLSWDLGSENCTFIFVDLMTVPVMVLHSTLGHLHIRIFSMYCLHTTVLLPPLSSSTHIVAGLGLPSLVLSLLNVNSTNYFSNASYFLFVVSLHDNIAYNFRNWLENTSYFLVRGMATYVPKVSTMTYETTPNKSTMMDWKPKTMKTATMATTPDKQDKNSQENTQQADGFKTVISNKRNYQQTTETSNNNTNTKEQKHQVTPQKKPVKAQAN